VNRRLAAVLLAVPVLLTGCGSDDEPAAAPRTSTAPSSTTAQPTALPTPTPTPSPTDSATAAQQWFENGGQAAQDALAQATKLGLGEPIDPAVLGGKCQQLVSTTQAAQALPPFPVPALQDELASSYTGLLDAAARCQSEAAAGVTDPLRSGLLVAVFNAVNAWQLALTDAGIAQVPS